MSDDLRQETEDMCLVSEACALEVDTETGEKPCVGCEDFVDDAAMATAKKASDEKRERCLLADESCPQNEGHGPPCEPECPDFILATNDPDNPPPDVVDIIAEDQRQEEIRTEMAATLKLLDKASEMHEHHKAKKKSASDSVERHESRLVELAREATTKPERSLLDGAGELTPTHPVGEDDAPAETTTEVALDEPGDDVDTPEGDGESEVL